MPAPVPSPMPGPCPVPTPLPDPEPWLSESLGASASAPRQSRVSAGAVATGATTWGRGAESGTGGGSIGRATGSGRRGRWNLLRLGVRRTPCDRTRWRYRTALNTAAFHLRLRWRRRLTEPAATPAAPPAPASPKIPAAVWFRPAVPPGRPRPGSGRPAIPRPSRGALPRPQGRGRVRATVVRSAGGLNSCRVSSGGVAPRRIRTARTASPAATKRPSTVPIVPAATSAMAWLIRAPATSAISRTVKTSGTAVMTEDMESYPSPSAKR